LKSKFIFVLLGTALLLPACSGGDKVKAPKDVNTGLSQQHISNKGSIVKTSANSRTRDELLFLILKAEMAAQENQLNVSVEAYLEAARYSSDPRIAERATRVASFARDYKSALLAAERWSELQPDKLDVYHSLIILYVRNKQIDNAVGAVDNVLRLTQKTRAQGFSHLIALLNKEADQQTVMQLMDRVTAKYNDNPESYFASARLSFQFKHYERAQNAISQALKLKPDMETAQSLQARVYMFQGESNKALAIMEVLVKKHPNSIVHRSSYARLLAVAKRYDNALVQFKQVLKVDPENTDVLYALALLTLEQGKFKASKKYFLRLLAQQKRVYDAYYYLGSIAEQQKKYAKSISWYQQVIHGQHKLSASIRVAQLLAIQGKLTEARAHLNKLISADPGLRVRLRIIEIDILSKEKDYKSAMQVANQSLLVDEKDPDLLYARSMLAEKVGDMALAESDLRKILEQDKDNVHALNALGYTLADHTVRLQEAYGYIKRALELAPQEAAILDSMGWVLYRLGRMDESIGFLRQALAITQDDEIAAHLGEVLWVSGKKDEARKLWKKVIQEVPDSIHIKKVMKRFK